MGKSDISVVALVPARSGSKRVIDKNIGILKGHPLIAYSIASAIQSGIFADVIVSTDSELYSRIAKHYGASVPFLRPAQMSDDLSPDIEWVDYTLTQIRKLGKQYDCFSILRPTSPFRGSETILRAWKEFTKNEHIDSLRAVEKCRQHPGKMWVLSGEIMYPLMPMSQNTLPWHSSPYQLLPDVYVQNASLEIAWTRVVSEQGSISGKLVCPFLTSGNEGFDINHPTDILLANSLIDGGLACLPKVHSHAFKLES